MRLRFLSFILLAVLFVGAGCSPATLQETEPVASTAAPQTTESILTLVFPDHIFTIPFTMNQSVYDVMVSMRDQGYITFDGTDYGEDMGFLIQSINGVANSVDDNRYWIYYVDDEKATVGISSYILEPDDVITWKYEAYEE